MTQKQLKAICKEYEDACWHCPYGKFIPRKTKPAYGCTVDMDDSVYDYIDDYDEEEE
jgi:hypothetical protein